MAKVTADAAGRPAPAPLGTGLTAVSATPPLSLSLNGTVLSAALDTGALPTRTKVQKSGVDVGTRGNLNLIPGVNIVITATDDGPNDQVDVEIAAPGGPGAVAGSGLNGVLPSWNGDGSDLHDSPVFTDGAAVGIGTKSPTDALHALRVDARAAIFLDGQGNAGGYGAVKLGSAYAGAEFLLAVGYGGAAGLQVRDTNAGANRLTIDNTTGIVEAAQGFSVGGTAVSLVGHGHLTSDVSGLGTIATQNADNVSITGGAISGVTLSASTVTATGLTSGYLPKAGTGGLLGNSPVFSDGTNVGIGTAGPGAKLHVAGAISGATVRYAMQSSATFGTDVTAAAYGLVLSGSTAAGSQTLANAMGLVVGDWTLGAGSAITAQYGLYVTDQTKATGNKVGIRSEVTAGASKWNLYLGGSAQNYISGNVLIGTLTSTGPKLEVNGDVKATTIKLTTAAASGYVWKCTNADGSGSWQAFTGGMTYKGTWDASTNTPTLADGTGTTGDTYAVTVSGTQFGRYFTAGGWCIYNGSIWEPVGTSVSVTSVNGLTGAVSLALASSAFVNQGTTTTVLHGNAAGNPSWGAVSLTADVSGILPVTNGGTGASAIPTWNQDTTGTAAGLSATLAVTSGGTGLATLAAGRIPFGNGTSPLSSSGDLMWYPASASLGIAVGFPTTDALHVASSALRASPRAIVFCDGQGVGGYAGFKLACANLGSEYLVTVGKDHAGFQVYDTIAAATRLSISNTTGDVSIPQALTVTGVSQGQIRDKGGQVHNVRAYGAVGNGSTDDTAAIGAAITAAAATTPRGVVYFPPGNYYTTGNYSLGGMHGLQIVGSGVGSTIITITHATNDLFYHTSPLHWFGLRNMSITASVTRTAGHVFHVNSTGFTVGGVRHCRFENLEITKQSNVFWFKWFEFVLVTNTLIHDPAPDFTGVSVRFGTLAGWSGSEGRCYNLQIYGSDLFGARPSQTFGRVGILIECCDAVELNDSGATGMWGHGLEIYQSVLNSNNGNHFFCNSIFDATVSGHSMWIHGPGAVTNMKMTGCWFSGAGQIPVWGSVPPTYGSGSALRIETVIAGGEFTGCNFFNCGGTGLYAVGQLEAFTLTGCTISGYGLRAITGNMDGIYLDTIQDAPGPVITGNSEGGGGPSGSVGIRTSATTNRIVVVGNRFVSGTAFGVTPQVAASNGY